MTGRAIWGSVSLASSLLTALALSLVSVRASGASPYVVVSGIVVFQKTKDNWVGAPKRTVGLYRLKNAGPRVALDTTTEDGLFTLKAHYQMSGGRAYVVDEEAAALPLRVVVPHADTPAPDVAKAPRLELMPCEPDAGVAQDAFIKPCLTAAARTHLIKQLAGAETSAQANEAIRKRTHSLLMNVPGWNEADVREALAAVDTSLADDPGFKIKSKVGAESSEQVLADAREVLEGRVGQCFDGIRSAPGRGGYAALGDRCEGDTVVTTSGGPKLVSLTEGRPELDAQADSVELSWNRRDTTVCLTVQPQSVDRAVTTVPRWRMTSRVKAGEDHFTWSVARARATGVMASPLGFLAKPCDQDDHHNPVLVPVLVQGVPSATLPFVVVIRTTTETHKVHVEVVETYASGTKENVTAKIGGFSPYDPHPLIWVEIPRSSKGPATARVSVHLSGSGSFGDQDLEPFSFQHD